MMPVQRKHIPTLLLGAAVATWALPAGPVSAAVAADLTFAAASVVSVGGQPAAVTAADLNLDGIADLASVDYTARTATAALGRGDGTFGAPVALPTGGSGPEGLAVGDVDGDGAPDLAVADVAGRVDLLRGDGSGGFAPAVHFAAGGGSPLGVAGADFDRDGRFDVATANAGSGSVGVLLGRADGTFGPARAYGVGYTGSQPRAVAVGDMNGDAVPDVVATSTSSSSGSVTVLLGNGDGTFRRAMTAGSGGGHPAAVAVGDLTGDGRADVAVPDIALAGTVGVLSGDGAGGFVRIAVLPTGGTLPRGARIADMNGDGRLDLMVAQGGGADGSVGVLAGRPDGTLAAAVAFPSGGTTALDLAAADLDADGRPDLAVANAASGTVGVLRNLTSAPQPEYQIAFASPAPGGVLRPGSTVTVRFVLRDETGRQITDTVAAGLAASPCRVRYAVTGAQTVSPACASYDTKARQFTGSWKVGRTLGPATVTATVTYPPTSASTSAALPVTIAR